MKKPLLSAFYPQVPSLGRRGILLLGLLGYSPVAFAQSGFSPATTYPSNGTSTLGVALGDVNGDGRPDIVAANQGTDNVSVLLSRTSPAGTFAPALTYSTGPGTRPTGVALGDVNGDGRLDVVTGNQTTGTVGVLLGLATAPGTFAPAVSYSSGGNSPTILALSDLNGDGRLDIATTNFDSGTVGVLLGLTSPAGTFAPAVTYATGSAGLVGITIGDVSGDGRLDIVTGNNLGGGVSVLLGISTAAGTFASATTYASGGTGTAGVSLGDVNSDGRLDIVAANSNSATVGVLLGAGPTPGAFASAVTYPSGGNGPNFAMLSDINGDGRLDIVTANYSNGTVGVLTGLTAAPGTFAPVVTYSSGGSGPGDIALADVNGDGRRDIVTANYVSGSVAVLLNSYVLAAASGQIPAAITLYPNPAHDAFTVLVPAGLGAATAQVELLNTLGQVVHRQQTAALPAAGARLLVETTGLPAGIYTVRFRAGAAAGTRRLVLQ